MKQIQPVSVWYNGTDQEAVTLNAYSTSDNLSSQATFVWQLFSAAQDQESYGITLSSGTLTMAGEDYTNWNADPDINEAAYSWIADQLSLTII